MNVSPVSFAVGFALVILYAIAFLFKRKKPPNLGALFVVFLVGPVIAESFDVMSISYRLAVDKQALDAGVFKDHVFVIAFTGVALFYAAAESVYVSFRQL